MSFYKTGTITLTNGSASVVGSGTQFVDVGTLNPGDALYAPDGKIYEVLSIQSNTGLTLASNYLGSNASGAAYNILPLGLLPSDLAQQVKVTLTTANTALSSSVRYDTATQGLSGTQKTNARTNIGALATGDAGSFTTLSATNVVTSSNPSAVKATATTANVAVFKTSDATDPLDLRINLTGSATSASRNAQIQVTEQNVGYRDLVLQPNGGNLGLGVTPSAWTGVKAIQVNGTCSVSADVNTVAVGIGYRGNVYTGFGATYDVSGEKIAAFTIDKGATAGSGSFKWLTAPSGTAGNPITFTQAMTLDASGNLLAGTTTPVPSGDGISLLPAIGSGSYFAVGHATGTPSGNYYGGFYYNNVAIGSITQNGTTAVAYNTTSDHRLKNNVRPANAARFMDIEFVDFEWVDGRHDCGVIAHQLQSVYPDLVLGEKDATEVREVEITPAFPEVKDEEGNIVTEAIPAVTEEQTFPKYQQVNYIGLIGRMGTTIQKQQRLIEAMEARLAALEAA